MILYNYNTFWCTFSTIGGKNMLIKDLFNNNKPVISFEIFPPKKNSPIETIYNTIEELKDLRPDFISVTYGAGGSSQGNTVQIASIIKNKYSIEALAHLTCVTSTKQDIDNILSSLKKENIENILALRGDIPSDPDFKFPDPLHYHYASDLVKEIKDTDNFCIAGACYPEGHFECIDKLKDLENLKKKVYSGTDFLITQLFFDNNVFYDFYEKAQSNNINIPISAGIMPVINKNQINRIASLCGATIPKKLIRIIEKYEYNPEALKEAGIAFATDQIIDLLSWGVDGIHLYTMNKPELATKIVNNITEIREALRTNVLD